MSEDTKDVDNRLKASQERRRKRVRELRREADRQDAGLFLQMTIEADLIDRGELDEDEYVKLERDADGNTVVSKVKIDDEVK